MGYLFNKKGSEWNKWDLHIHTPASIVQYYGNNDDETWEKFIDDLENLPKEFKVIGINDYLFLDGYKKVLEYKKNGRLKNIELLLPVLEFRIEKFAGIDFGKLSRINLHVIFSNELSVETIQSQFLNGLEQSYKIEKDGNEWNRAITKESISDLGKELKKSVPSEELHKYGSDLEEGFNNLNISEEKIFELLKRDIFRDKYLIAVGKTEWAELKWSDSSIATKKSIINRADIVFTASESIEALKKAKNQLKKQNVNDLLLDCSDAHNFSNSPNKDRIGNSFTWIKAEPTFEGLKQIIYEPEDRVSFEEPELLKRVRANRTKFIRSLKIKQVSEYNEKQGIWFKNIEIPFNPGLIAIIGNKGSGKSAVVDILGLCGNSHQYEDFSFLKEDRFLEKGLAKNFEATVEWEDSSITNKNLSDKPDFSSPERVRYLPQSFFEKLTNEIKERDFPQTLENIVFSYLPDEQKLGTTSFQELIKFKQDAIEKEIKLILEEIDELNEEIIELEKKQHPAYRKKLEEKLFLKKKELEEHQKNKPQEVKNPEKDSELSEEQQKYFEELEKLNEGSKGIDEEINNKRRILNNLTLEREELDQLIKGLELEKQRIEKFKQENKEKFEKFDLNIDTIINFEVNTQELEQKIKEKKNQINDIQELLLTNEEIGKKEEKERKILREKSLIVKKDNINSKIKTIKEKLSKPEREYQEYRENLKKWEETKKELLGSEDRAETIKWLEKQIAFINNELNSKLASLRKQRVARGIDIYEKKNELVEIYKQFKKAVDDKISSHSEILGDYEITIESALNIKNEFITRFLSFINQRLKGSFYGKEEGEALLRERLNNIDVNSKEDVQKLLENIINLLEVDHREAFKEKSKEEKRRYIFEQVKELKVFYNYLFSLEYIEPIYELKLGAKSISQLSPGEKGALLIVFYLMLDKDNIPLIIDQPEENLDNESIYKILTKFIRLAKQRRQLIMVTHNPNLAIVGDAEQIIYVTIDKKNQNAFSFKSGAIENPVINRHASDILEGTLKAFDVRRLKYFKISDT